MSILTGSNVNLNPQRLPITYNGCIALVHDYESPTAVKVASKVDVSKEITILLHLRVITGPVQIASPRGTP